MIAKEREFLAKVLPAYAEAARKGSIELSAAPSYHPILPLLCDTNVGAQSTPRLSLPRDVSVTPMTRASRFSGRWIRTKLCSVSAQRIVALRGKRFGGDNDSGAPSRHSVDGD